MEETLQECFDKANADINRLQANIDPDNDQQIVDLRFLITQIQNVGNQDLNSWIANKIQNNTELNCSICLEPLRSEQDTTVCINIPCGHFFHCDCMEQYFIPYNSYNCPLCRLKICYHDEVPNFPIKNNFGSKILSDICYLKSFK